MFKELPVITTQRLVLREVKETDKEAYFKYVSDPDVKTQFRFDYDQEKSAARVEELTKRYRDEKDIPKVWAIAKQENDELVGIITLFPTSVMNRFVELTWGIIAEERGHGYIKEAAQGLIEWLFKNTEVNRIQAMHSELNEYTKKIIEELGFTYEATLREHYYRDGKFYDRKMYSILRREYEK